MFLVTDSIRTVGVQTKTFQNLYCTYRTRAIRSNHPIWNTTRLVTPGILPNLIFVTPFYVIKHRPIWNTTRFQTPAKILDLLLVTVFLIPRVRYLQPCCIFTEKNRIRKKNHPIHKALNAHYEISLLTLISSKLTLFTAISCRLGVDFDRNFLTLRMLFRQLIFLLDNANPSIISWELELILLIFALFLG